MTSKPVSPPRAKQICSETTLHGKTRHDPYAWIKDPNWQHVMHDPSSLREDIRAYLEAENSYTKQVLFPTEDLQAELFKEMKGRIKENDSTVPEKDGAFSYFSKYRVGGEHPLYCRQPNSKGKQEEILLDGDELAKGKAYFNIGDCTHSPDHNMLAYSIDDAGSEIYSIHFKSLAQDIHPQESIPGVTGSLIWSSDSTTLFYILQNENLRPYKVMRHQVGTDPADDVLVYEEKDSGFFISLDKSESGKFIIISAHDHETSEVHVIPSETPTAPPRIIAPRETGVEYDLSHWGDRFFILTNADQAEDFKLVSAPVTNPGRKQWQGLIAHEQGLLRLSHLIFDNHLVLMERINALPRIRIIKLGTNGELGEEHFIDFDEEAYALGLLPGYEFKTSKLRFTYASPTTPTQTYEYDMTSRERVLLKTQEVPSGHNADNYTTQRITVTATDNAQIPVTLLYKKDTPLDGSAPLLLYGYGSYGHAIPAQFSTTILSLVNRGFIYAIAHIRGGMECGYDWYKKGKLKEKKNTFSDFIAVATALIDQNYTLETRIIAHGGSAGGMLMGAIANMAPHLFGGIIADVPFVDVLNTMCDDTLPLTPPEWPEWGNPIEDEEAYETIAAYSPYDNVTAQDYPAMLVTAGLTDPRVTYWEPVKWVAKLRAERTDDNLLLLKTHMEAGHGGASGRFEHLRDIALAYAFALFIMSE